jgi:hypothetical protein
VDNPRSFTSALVDRISWPRRRWANSPAARDCANCVDYQSGFWPKSYLARFVQSRAGKARLPTLDPGTQRSGPSTFVVNRTGGDKPVLTRPWRRRQCAVHSKQRFFTSGSVALCGLEPKRKSSGNQKGKQTGSKKSAKKVVTRKPASQRSAVANTRGAKKAASKKSRRKSASGGILKKVKTVLASVVAGAASGAAQRQGD